MSFLLSIFGSFGMKQYAYIALAVAVLGLVGYGYALKASNARLRAENAILETNLAVQKRQILQFKVAEAVADANDTRQDAIEIK